MCGIVGIVSTEPVNQQVYDSLLLLQHRGQDSTGIATAERSGVFHIAKAKGQVREAFRTRDMRALLGEIGLGHVRYATKGTASNEEEAQPFYVNAPYGIVLVHNGNLTNTRELPQGAWVEVDRSTWSPSPVFRVLADLGGLELEATEGTWNLGLGFLAVVSADQAEAAASALSRDGIATWQVGVVRTGDRPADGHWEQGAKGVDGGAVRLVGAYADHTAR